MGTGERSLEAMDKLVRDLTRVIDEHEDVCRSIVASYEAVGEDWHDEKYEELGNVVREVSVELLSPQAHLSECITRVQLLRRMLEEYLRTRV